MLKEEYKAYTIEEGKHGFRIVTNGYDYNTGDSIENLASFYNGDEIGLVNLIESKGNKVTYIDCTNDYKETTKENYLKHLEDYNSDVWLVIPCVTFTTREKAEEIVNSFKVA